MCCCCFAWVFRACFRRKREYGRFTDIDVVSPQSEFSEILADPPALYAIDIKEEEEEEEEDPGSGGIEASLVRSR